MNTLVTMSRKTIIVIISLLFILTLFMLSYIIVINIDESNYTEIQTTPKFSFINVSRGGLFVSDSIKNRKSCLIIYFHSECDHCQYEAKEISKNFKRFENYQLLMISYEAVDSIINFKEKYKLNHDNITFLHDKEYKFEEIFGHTPIPTSFIYNRNQELVKVFKGEVKIEALLKYLEN